MTSFNEDSINRAADGKFAAKTTSESDVGLDDDLQHLSVGQRFADLGPGESVRIDPSELGDEFEGSVVSDVMIEHEPDFGRLMARVSLNDTVGPLDDATMTHDVVQRWANLDSDDRGGLVEDGSNGSFVVTRRMSANLDRDRSIGQVYDRLADEEFGVTNPASVELATWSTNTSLDRDLPSDSRAIDLGEDDFTDAEIIVDDEGETSISASIEVNFADDINPEVLNAHPVVAFEYVENRFGVSRIGTFDDPSEGVRFEMMSKSDYVSDDEEAISNFYATTKAREFKDSVNGGGVEPLGKGVRRAYEMWGLDPDDESKNDRARPDLSSDELREYITTHGTRVRDMSLMSNPTNAPVAFGRHAVPEQSTFVVRDDGAIVVQSTYRPGTLSS